MERPQRKSVCSWSTGSLSDHLQGCAGRTLAPCIPGQNPTTEEPGLKGPKPHLKDQRKWTPKSHDLFWSQALSSCQFLWPCHSLICDQGHAMFTKTTGILTSEWHQIIGHEHWSSRRSSDSSFMFHLSLWVIVVIVPTQANFSPMCQGDIMASK